MAKAAFTRPISATDIAAVCDFDSNIDADASGLGLNHYNWLINGQTLGGRTKPWPSFKLGNCDIIFLSCKDISHLAILQQ